MNRLGTIRMRMTLWYTILLVITVLGFSFYLDLELQDSLGVQIDAGLQVAAADHILQPSFAIRMVTSEGEVIAEVVDFPDLAFTPPTSGGFTDVEIQGIP